MKASIPSLLALAAIASPSAAAPYLIVGGVPHEDGSTIFLPESLQSGIKYLTVSPEIRAQWLLKSKQFVDRVASFGLNKQEKAQINLEVGSGLGRYTMSVDRADPSVYDLKAAFQSCSFYEPESISEPGLPLRFLVRSKCTSPNGEMGSVYLVFSDQIAGDRPALIYIGRPIPISIDLAAEKPTSSNLPADKESASKSDGK